MGCIAVLEGVEAFFLKYCPSYRLSAFSIFIFPSHSPQSLPCSSEATSYPFYACCYSTFKSIYSICIFLYFQAPTSHFCRQTEPRYQICTNATTGLYFSQAPTAIGGNLLPVPRQNLPLWKLIWYDKWKQNFQICISLLTNKSRPVQVFANNELWRLWCVNSGITLWYFSTHLSLYCSSI